MHVKVCRDGGGAGKGRPERTLGSEPSPCDFPGGKLASRQKARSLPLGSRKWVLEELSNVPAAVGWHRGEEKGHGWSPAKAPAESGRKPKYLSYILCIILTYFPGPKKELQHKLRFRSRRPAGSLESVIGALKGYKKKKSPQRSGWSFILRVPPSIKATYYKPLSPLEHFLLSAFWCHIETQNSWNQAGTEGYLYANLYFPSWSRNLELGAASNDGSALTSLEERKVFSLRKQLSFFKMKCNYLLSDVP